MSARLVLVAGMPGAGKTTLARDLAAAYDAVLLSADAWILRMGLDPHDARLRRRVEKALWQHGQDLLGRGADVVLDFGFWSRLDRAHKRRDARALGAEVELHALDVPLEERWRRLEQRNATEPRLVIARAQLEEWEHWWQPVTADELAAYDAPRAPR